MEFTGERLIPGNYGKIAAEHLHRYALCIEFVKGKVVLDIASGEGYGSNLLSTYAGNVLGVDISEDAVMHSQKTYVKQNLRFKVGSVLNIPCDSKKFEVVVSFETLEHISDHLKMISEIKRVLTADGILIISTPEKSVYSDLANYSNPYHEKELYEQEFVDTLKNEFQYIQLGYQKYLRGSLIQSPNSIKKEINFFEGDFKTIDIEKPFNKEYLIAVCSNSQIDHLFSNSFFNSVELEKNQIDELVNSRLVKFKSGFRYKLINFLFKPWDIIKGFSK